MTAQQFFQAYFFKQLCQQKPFENVLILPLEMEMTLLKLARLGELDLEKLEVDGLEDYLEEREVLVKGLVERYPRFFELDMENPEHNISPLKFMVNWRNWLNIYEAGTDDFYTFNGEIIEQNYLSRDWDNGAVDSFYLKTPSFQALRLATRIKDIVVEFYLPHSKQNFIHFIENFDVETFKAWDTQFEPLDFYNALIPSVDMEFDLNYSDFLDIKTPLQHCFHFKLWDKGVGTLYNPLLPAYFRGGTYEYGSPKMLDFNRPFFLCIREQINHSILCISAITEPMTPPVHQQAKEANCIFKYYKKRLPELNIRGHLAIHYVGVQTFYQHFKVKDDLIEKYLVILQNCIKVEKTLINEQLLALENSQKIFSKENQAHRLQKKTIPTLRNFIQQESLTTIIEWLDTYEMGLYLPSEFSDSINCFHFIEKLHQYKLPYPSFDYFASFLMSDDDIIGEAARHFDFHAPIIKQLPPPDFLNDLARQQSRYRAYRNFKPLIWSMSDEEKVALMAKCIDVYLEVEQLFVQEWEDLKPSIHQFITLPETASKKKIAGRKIIDFRQFGRCEQIGSLPKFHFLTKENQQNILTLKNKEPLFVELLESFGTCVYYKITEEEHEGYLSKSYWNVLEEQGFFKTYFQSKYPIDFLIGKTKN